MKLTPIFLILFLFSTALIPAHAASTQTYTFTVPTESWFSGAVEVNNHTYIAGSTEIFDYGNGNFTQVLKMASGHLITDIIQYGQNIALADIEYQVNSSSGSGGGAIIEAQATPLEPSGVNNTQRYDILKTEVLILNSTFSTVSTYSDSEKISVDSAEGLLNSFKIASWNGDIVGYVAGQYSPNSTVYSKIRDFTAGADKLTFWGQEVRFLTAGAYLYVGLENYVNLYDSSWNLVKQATDIGGYSTYVNALAVGNNETWSVGYSSVSGATGASVSVNTPNFSAAIMFDYHTNSSYYTGITVYNTTAYVLSEDSHVYIYTDTQSKPVGGFASDFSYLKSMTDGQYYTLASGTKIGARSITFLGDKVIFGGYVIGENHRTALYLTVKYLNQDEKPSGWQDPGDGGFIPFSEQTWEKYKYEILAVGAVFLLILLSGGRRR